MDDSQVMRETGAPCPSADLRAHNEVELMRRISTTIAATVITALAVAPAAAQAAPADPHTYTFAPQARVIPYIQTSGDGSTATVRAVYVCNEGDHLWVSAKQVKDATQDPRLSQGGSSAISEAWLQTHRRALTCDNRWHYDSFTIDTVEGGSKGKLKAGWAWYQFCLTKSGAPGTEGTLLINESGWARVV